MKRTDWAVRVVLDRDALVEDIHGLLDILRRQRVRVVVSASNSEEAEEEARLHLERVFKIPPRYVRSLRLRRMPT